ncbi:MAG TPA: hypothetical protein VFM93_09470 [Candidatus Limnocylindria bacterium]|nr:hypothetical protein [Candidatus Limnocylindria bacterium]
MSLRAPKAALEHPAQLVAATFLRAVAEGDAVAVWERLSRESRGLLEGLYAARSRVAAHEAAGVAAADARLAEVVGPLRDAVLRASGGPERIGGFGVSAARILDRHTVFVLLLPDFGEERIVREDEWTPAHLLALTYESREWVVDLGRTSTLSAEAGLVDPLGRVGA